MSQYILFSINASKAFCPSSQRNPLSQAAFNTHKQDSSATSMDILGKMLPYVLRGMIQPHLKIKFKKTCTSHVGKQKSSVCNCVCPHGFAHVHTEPSLWETAAVALQLLFPYIRRGVWMYDGSHTCVRL